MPYIRAAMGNIEDKYNDVSSLATSLGTTPTQVLLNGLSQGTTAVTRIGQSIKTVNLEVTLTVSVDNVSTEPQYVRWVIVRDDQCNGSAFSSTTYWVSNSVYSFTNVSADDRFYTYKDEIVCVSPNGPEGYIHRSVIPLSFHTKYNSGNAGTIADIYKGSLYFMAISSDNTNTPELSANFRLWFVDN